MSKLYDDFLYSHSLSEFVRHCKDNSMLSVALRNKKVQSRISNLIRDSSLPHQTRIFELRYLWSAIDHYSELSSLKDDLQDELLRFLLDNNCVDFRQIVDKYRNIRYSDGASCLNYLFLRNGNFLRELFKNQTLTADDCRYLIQSFETPHEFNSFITYFYHIAHYVLKNSILTFRELVDLTKSLAHDSCTGLERMLSNNDFFQKLFQHDLISLEDISHLLNSINNWKEVRYLADNTHLLEKILDNFLLTPNQIEKFEELIKYVEFYRDYSDEITNFFDYISYVTDIYLKPDEFKHMFEIKERFYIDFLKNFSKDEQNEILLKLQTSTSAKQHMMSILENNLESEYTNFKVL